MRVGGPGQNTNMVVRVDVQREVLEWARERARLQFDDLAVRFPKLRDWETGDVRPTLKQLEQYARTTHTPVGYLLLDEPPSEPVPIPDFRTMPIADLTRPSADLLDTIYQTQIRQGWYRDHVEASGGESLVVVGSLSITTSTVDAAHQMRDALSFGVSDRGTSWSAALVTLIERSEGLGILVMVNGVVGSNTHRKLDPSEFRGFALVDSLAPVVFINGSDTKAAQIFTLAHELAHIWLGEAGLDDVVLDANPNNPIESWCNDVAAELLVPADDLRAVFDAQATLTGELERLASRFRVSTLVILRRLRDQELISASDFPTLYRQELQRVLDLIGARGGGGNFYNTLPVRVSKRFARTLIASTLEGRTLYRDALQMLGFKKLSTFRELSEKLGVA
jgi:Zn-dependent peptidase ImmA (M78 family)